MMTMKRPPCPTFCLRAACLLLAVTPVAYAQQAAEPDPATRLDTIEVEAARTRGYHADASQLDTFGSFGQAPLQDTPAAISVITRDQLDDRQPRSLSELARSDAALGDNYAPVGYYENLMIRGFALDLATGYRYNQMSRVGEQALALEDKERVEVLKGLGGLEAGVVSPGGLINYVSKRPAAVSRASLGTDAQGSRYLAVDLGKWLIPTFGLRVNAAHEDIHSYVEHADGHRNFLSLAADWKLGQDTSLQLDSNYHASSQRSASGYQLLGGQSVPDAPQRKRMLGYQPWQEPVGIDASNTTVQLDTRLSQGWSARLGLGHSRAVIDDNVAYAYGCFYAPECASGDAPGWFFAPNGDYDIYDYRSPDDTRSNDEVRIAFNGLFDTGPINHELSLGASVFRRTIERRPYVYDYVGTANIHDEVPQIFAPSPRQPGAPVRRFDSWQRAVFALDRIHLGEHWQWLVGGRQVRLDERAWKSSGRLNRETRLTHNLPQTAVLWRPDPRLTAYASYSESLSLGDEAPYWTSNDGEFLAPRLARQHEIGVKLSPRRDLNLGAALYRIAQPYQFAQPDETPAGFTFIEQGEQRHEGLELNAAGTLSENLRVTASLNLVRAHASDTGTPAYEGHQVVNVPRRRAAIYLDWALPTHPDTSLLAGWRHAAANPATPDGAVEVPGYDVFDFGLRHLSRWNDHELTWRLSVDNVFDRFYWRDTGNSGGENFLFPGAPRLARLSVTWNFR